MTETPNSLMEKKRKEKRKRISGKSKPRSGCRNPLTSSREEELSQCHVAPNGTNLSKWVLDMDGRWS